MSSNRLVSKNLGRQERKTHKNRSNVRPPSPLATQSTTPDEVKLMTVALPDACSKQIEVTVPAANDKEKKKEAWYHDRFKIVPPLGHPVNDAKLDALLALTESPPRAKTHKAG